MQNITYTQLSQDKSIYELTGKCHEHSSTDHAQWHGRFTNSSLSNPLRKSSTKNYDKVGQKYNSHH